MPHAFLFDIGNVILPFDYGLTAHKLAAHASCSPSEILQRVTPLSIDLELGRISPDQFIDKVSELIGYQGNRDYFHTAFADIFDPNLPLIALIESLKSEGHPLYLLSNTNGIHAPFFEAAYPVFQLFDGGIYSHEVGLMKPDPAIFELAKSRFSLDPRRTLYIDDLEANCAAGEAAGFRSFVYAKDRHEALLDLIRALPH